MSTDDEMLDRLDSCLAGNMLSLLTPEIVADVLKWDKFEGRAEDKELLFVLFAVLCTQANHYFRAKGLKDSSPELMKIVNNIKELTPLFTFDERPLDYETTENILLDGYIPADLNMALYSMPPGDSGPIYISMDRFRNLVWLFMSILASYEPFDDNVKRINLDGRENLCDCALEKILDIKANWKFREFRQKALASIKQKADRGALNLDL
jgi:hypothetical protein